MERKTGFVFEVCALKFLFGVEHNPLIQLQENTLNSSKKLL
jgi:hypothetical protein